MGEQFASFGLRLADPAVPWPPRGAGETELTNRSGWERRTIPATIRGKSATIEAMCRDDLAVNVMVEDKGFAICLAASGYRISHRGRVYARCADAMRAAEQMMDGNSEWCAVQARGLSAEQVKLLGSITDAAEKRGEILLDMVFPT